MSPYLTIPLGVLALGLPRPSVAQVPAYVPTAGLIGWYPFNGNANDESGLGHDGTITGVTLTADRDGVAGHAYLFPGNNEHISCGVDTSLTNHVNISSSAWFTVENRPGGWEQNIILATIGPYQASGGFQVVVANPPGADIGGMFRNGTHLDQGLPYAAAIAADTWHHIAYTLSYSAGTDMSTARLYLDGAQVATQQYPQSVNYDAITPLLIGLNYDSGLQRSFKGKIDDVGVWNRTLDAWEIIALHQGAVGVHEIVSDGRPHPYPNPAHNVLYVDMQGLSNADGYRVLNSVGQVVQQGLLVDGQNTIDLSTLAPGMYLLTLPGAGATPTAFTRQ